ncbi:MAG: TIGR04283 family arsenosugar biosynthesis glycosyltransferase [Myxococcota bacterium]|nr:TIGR04283 family arsenosugar biosynthesis glycosyltransferase [Myxococcota bacterium]
MSARIPIVVFAKPPTAGAVKTRLAEPERAAALARAFLLDTFAALRSIPWAEPILATTGEIEPRLRDELGLPVWLQGNGDLGARIERVLGRALLTAPAAIAIGGDTPGLPLDLLERARAALETADAAIGPTEDGGFYLLGLRRCRDGLLADLPWSRADTFRATLDRLQCHAFTPAVLEPWFDVDRPADLVRLRALLEARVLRAPATRQVINKQTISVVMPVLDEEQRIGAALSQLGAIQGLHEVIVADGGSTDRTVEIARSHRVRIVTAARGRGTQLNAGAAAATGDVLLFLHADTSLPLDAIDHVAQALRDARVLAGAFRTWTVADEPRPWYAPLLHLADVRSRVTRYPYGDQAMFVRTSAFREVGGFPDVPLMEDLELSCRLARLGRIHRCRASVRVSGRRFVARPIAYAAMMNLFPLLHRAGVSPQTLARFYGHVR